MSDPQVKAFKGSVQVPPDKSISHRALIFAAMAEGRSHLTNLLDSQDVRSTVSCLRALGADIDVVAGDGRSFDAEVEGWGARGPQTPDEPLDCGNSGTTARLLCGVLAGSSASAVLTGDASLSKRPMGRVAVPLALMGARFSKPDGGDWAGESVTLPMRVTGAGKPRRIDYDMPVASAQVKTAVLLAALFAEGATSVSEPQMSRNHTELMLPAFGSNLDSILFAEGRHMARMYGGQPLHACDVTVPGDASSAMFLAVAAALVPGSEICIQGVGLNPTRAAALDVMSRMGCHLEVEPHLATGGEPSGDLYVSYAPGLRAPYVGAEEIPALIDEVPVLSLLATSARGMTIFKEVGELRVKESNRLAAIVEGLTALGCEAREDGDDLKIVGGAPTRSITLDSRGDHRLAMTWVLANRCFGLAGDVTGLDCIDVSYPDFLQTLEQLQG